jgi:hypothetical protein
MATKKERDDGLARQTSQTDEIAPERLAEEARIDIQSAIIVARKFPRNEQQAYQKLMHACERTSFAEDAQYSFPRWSSEEQRKVDIIGPSVKLAREAGRLWGNIRWGITIIADGDDTRTIEGWAYDLETNARPAYQDTFTKMGYVKGGGWEPLNERGLRETTSRRGAFLIRNAILNLIPSDFIDDAMQSVDKTLASEAKKDPDAENKRIISAFDSIGVQVAELESFLGHGLSSASPAEIKKLRGIYKSIDDGNSTWAEYLGKKEASADSGKKQPSGPAPAASTNEKPVAAAQSNSTPPPTANGKPITEPSGASGKTISDQEKGLVWQVARKKGWASGSGTPDDALHQLLKKQYGIDSVTKIKSDDLPAILNALANGPAGV